jgi:hypothetical protein
MKRVWVWLVRRPWLMAALLASSFYLWQTLGEWKTVFSASLDDDTRRFGLSGPIAVGVSGTGAFGQRTFATVPLRGQGVATGASGVLRFNGYRGFIGQLRLNDMPILPPTHIYQLWCVDIAGSADAATLFRVPIDSEGNLALAISAPRPLSIYRRFYITVQTIGEPVDEQGPVVLSD